MNINPYRFTGQGLLHLHDYSTGIGGLGIRKEEALPLLEANQRQMSLLQDRLYAENKESVLIIFQAMDAAGKDSAIKHVISGMNPQGVTVHNFKQPCTEELNHDYLWRAFCHLPARGCIGIFNRSYYEDVLVVKVHGLHKNSNLPERCLTGTLFEDRYKHITDFERYLYQNGTRIIKIFLHLSKNEQKNRFLKRIDNPEKNWKFSRSDIEERSYWEPYQKAYEQAIRHTASPIAPWYIVPADKKWLARLIISQIILETLQDINPQYPQLPEETAMLLQECRKKLLAET